MMVAVVSEIHGHHSFWLLGPVIGVFGVVAATAEVHPFKGRNLCIDISSIGGGPQLAPGLTVLAEPEVEQQLLVDWGHDSN